MSYSMSMQWPPIYKAINCVYKIWEFEEFAYHTNNKHGGALNRTHCTLTVANLDKLWAQTPISRFIWGDRKINSLKFPASDITIMGINRPLYMPICNMLDIVVIYWNVNFDL
jgi:hypothetical protein